MRPIYDYVPLGMGGPGQGRIISCGAIMVDGLAVPWGILLLSLVLHHVLTTRFCLWYLLCVLVVSPQCLVACLDQALRQSISPSRPPRRGFLALWGVAAEAGALRRPVGSGCVCLAHFHIDVRKTNAWNVL